MTNGNLFADIVLHLFKFPTFTSAPLHPKCPWSMIELKFPYLTEKKPPAALTDLIASWPGWLHAVSSSIIFHVGLQMISSRAKKTSLNQANIRDRSLSIVTCQIKLGGRII